METKPNFQHFFRTQQILFFALLLAQVSMGSLLMSLPQGATVAAYQQPFWLQVIAGFSVLLVGAAMFLRKKLLESARSKENLSEKLLQYRVLQVVHWAMLEGGAFVNIVFYFISRQMEFVYIAGAILALFILQFPSKTKLFNELELSSEEQAALDDSGAGHI